MDTYELIVRKCYNTVSYSDRGWNIKVPKQNEATIKLKIPFNEARVISFVDRTPLAELQKDDTGYYMLLQTDEIYIKFTPEFMAEWSLDPYTTMMPRIILAYEFEMSSFKEFAWMRS